MTPTSVVLLWVVVVSWCLSVGSLAVTVCTTGTGAPYNVEDHTFTTTSTCAFTNDDPLVTKVVAVNFNTLLVSANAAGSGVVSVRFASVMFNLGVRLSIVGLNSQNDALVASTSNTAIIDMEIVGCTFVGTLSGAALYVTGYIALDIDINNIIVVSNSGWDGLSAPASFSDTSGGVGSRESTIRITNNLFSSNTADYPSPAIWGHGDVISPFSLVKFEAVILANRSRVLFVGNRFEMNHDDFTGSRMCAIVIQRGSITHGSRFIIGDTNVAIIRTHANSGTFLSTSFLVVSQSAYSTVDNWAIQYNSTLVMSADITAVLHVDVGATLSFVSAIAVGMVSIKVERGSYLLLCQYCTANIILSKVDNTYNGAAFLMNADGQGGVMTMEASTASRITMWGGTINLISNDTRVGSSTMELVLWRVNGKGALNAIGGSAILIGGITLNMNVTGNDLSASGTEAVRVRVLGMYSSASLAITGGSTFSIFGSSITSYINFPLGETNFEVLYLGFNIQADIGHKGLPTIAAASNVELVNCNVKCHTNSNANSKMALMRKGSSSAAVFIIASYQGSTGSFSISSNTINFKSTNTLAVSEIMGIYIHDGKNSITGAESRFLIMHNTATYQSAAAASQRYMIMYSVGSSVWEIDYGKFIVSNHVQSEVIETVPDLIQYVWITVETITIRGTGQCVIQDSYMRADSSTLSTTPKYIEAALIKGLSFLVESATTSNPVILIDRMNIVWNIPVTTGYSSGETRPILVYWSQAITISSSSTTVQPVGLVDSTFEVHFPPTINPPSGGTVVVTATVIAISNNNGFGLNGFLSVTRSTFQAVNVNGGAPLLNATTGAGELVFYDAYRIGAVRACNVSLKDSINGVVPITNETVLNTFIPPEYNGPLKATNNCEVALPPSDVETTTTPTTTTPTTTTTAPTTTPTTTTTSTTTPTTTTTTTTATTTTPTTTTTTTPTTTSTTTTPTTTSTTTTPTTTTTTTTPTTTTSTTTTPITTPPPTCDGVQDGLDTHMSEGKIHAGPGVTTNSTPIPYTTWSTWYNSDNKMVVIRLRSSVNEMAFANYSLGAQPCTRNYGWSVSNVSSTLVDMAGRHQQQPNGNNGGGGSTWGVSIVKPPTNSNPESSYMDMYIVLPTALSQPVNTSDYVDNTTIPKYGEYRIELSPRGSAAGSASTAESADMLAASPGAEACCQGNGTFIIRLAAPVATTPTPTTRQPPTIDRELEDATGVTILIGGALVLPGVALQQGNGMALLRMSTCKDDSIGEPLPQLVHPLQFPIGDDNLKYYRGSVVGNVFIIPIVFAVVIRVFGIRLVGLVNKKVGLPSTPEDVMSLVGWPSVMVIPFVVTVEGTTASGVRLGQLGGAGDATLGAFGVGAPTIVAILWIVFMKIQMPLRNLKLLTNPSGVLGEKVHKAIVEASKNEPSIHMAYRPMWLWQLFHPVYEWAVECDTVRASTWSLMEDNDNNNSTPMLGRSRETSTAPNSASPSSATNKTAGAASSLPHRPLPPPARERGRTFTLNEEEANAEETEDGFVDVDKIEGMREYLQKATMETAFNQGEHCVGEFWFLYAEWVGLCMGIIVGVCEGVLPTSDLMCIIRIAIAFAATFIQCVLILTMLVPVEALLTLGGSVLVIIVAGASVMVVAGSDGEEQLLDLLRDSASGLVILGALTMAFGIIRWAVRVYGRFKEVQDRKIRRRGLTTTSSLGPDSDDDDPPTPSANKANHAPPTITTRAFVATTLQPEEFDQILEDAERDAEVRDNYEYDDDDDDDNLQLLEEEEEGEGFYYEPMGAEADEDDDIDLEDIEAVLRQAEGREDE